MSLKASRINIPTIERENKPLGLTKSTQNIRLKDNAEAHTVKLDKLRDVCWDIE